MDTKMIFRFTQALCEGIYSPQSMSQNLREATYQINNNCNIDATQVNDLELSCLILHEYLKGHPGQFNLADSVTELLLALDKRNLTSATVGHYDNRFSTTRLIRGGKNIGWAPPKI